MLSVVLHLALQAGKTPPLYHFGAIGM